MRRSHHALIVGLTALAMLTTACSSTWWLRGTVRQAAVCATGAQGAAVVDATVRVVCDGKAALIATTDAEGLVAVPLEDPIAGDCAVEVTAPGHRPWSIAVSDACAWPRAEGRCAAMSISARLTPEAP